jgi:ketosteroid isomerase-like protein
VYLHVTIDGRSIGMSASIDHASARTRQCVSCCATRAILDAIPERGDTGRAMSQENVELVHAGFEAFARGDIEAVLRLCDEDIVITQPSEMPDAGPFLRGHAGVLETIAAWPEQWDDYRIEIRRTVEIEDYVVATVHQTGRGKSTGIPVETEATMVFAIRQGKIAEWRIFLQEDEALEAVGLRE